MMQIFLLISMFCPFGPPATTSAPVAVTTQPALSSAMKSKVEDLIKQLDDRDFKRRESAQRDLASMGEEIWPLLIEQLSNQSEEVNDRIIAVVGKPREPVLRVELAVRMLSTGDPARIEAAVYMLFEDPVAVCDLFERRTAGSDGILRIVVPPVTDQLHIRRGMINSMKLNMPRIREKNPESAERLAKLDSENNWYAAEAAALLAIESLDESAGASRTATSQPTRVRIRD